MFEEFGEAVLGGLMLIVRSLSPWLRPTHRFFWPYLLVFIVIGYILACRKREGLVGLREFVRFLFPRKVWAHAHAVQSYKYVVSLLLFYRFTTFGGVVLSTVAVANVTQGILENGFGTASQRTVGLWTAGAYLAATITVADFAQYLLHRVQHRAPFLWELHKVHHYPERITPVTALQVHPLEGMMKGATNSIALGLLTGVFSYHYERTPLEWSLYGLTLSGLATNLFSNFRHSHIWVQFPRWLSPFLSSPAMHQIHHSRAPRHFNRNFAIVFSFWDTWFGSLYVPEEEEVFELGLANDGGEFPTVVSLYWYPLARAWNRLVR